MADPKKSTIRGVKRTLALLLLLGAGDPARGAPSAPKVPKAPNERHLSRQIVGEFFDSKKSEAARKLGRLQTPTARNTLQRLYTHRDVSIRLAALDGLFERRDATLGPWFVLQLNTVKQKKLSTRIAEGLGKDLARYLDAVLQATPALDRLTPALLEGLAKSKDKRAPKLLAQLLAGPPAPQQAQVAQVLLKHHPSARTARRVIACTAASSMHIQAWTQLLNRGSQSDLPSFLALATPSHGDAHRVIAYRATQKWGTPEQRQKVYLRALLSKREVLALAAAKTFWDQTPALRRALCDWVQRGRYQTMRLTAAKNLSAYPTRHVVGCLILALREKFHAEPPDQSFVKYAVGILSFGLGFYAWHRERKERRLAFDSVLTALSARLRQLTGVDFGNDYNTWLDWALRRGYTVGDMNIVQLLFSPYPQVRRRAQQDAIWLLDERGDRLQRKHASDTDGGAALRVALAHLLIDAGLLAPRRIPLANAPAPVAPHSKRPVGTGCGGCYACQDCRDCHNDCDAGHRGNHGIPASWLMVLLWFLIRRRRRRKKASPPGPPPARLLLLLGVMTSACITSSAQARGAKRTQEARLATRIRAARFSSEKKPLVLRLARLRTPAARTTLIRLITELEPFDRPVAVAGLLALKDPTLLPLLLHHMFTGFWVKSPIASGLLKDMPIYFSGLEKAFHAPHKKMHRRRHDALLVLMATGRDPRGKKLLQGLVTDKGSAWRQRALELLIAHWTPSSDAFLRGLLTDPTVGDMALGYVLRKGSAADLPLFRRLADEPGSGERVAAGFRGIQRFGDASLQERTFDRELRGKSKRRAHLALLSFTIRSPTLRTAICRWALSNDKQSPRIAAVMQLLRYDSRQVIPCLVPFLREEYAGRDGSSIWHGVLAFMSLGISAISIDARTARSIKGFRTAQRRVAAHLAKIAGVDYQTHYWRWRDWAAEQGFTVEGHNLLQALLSADKQRRRRAQLRALTLLGFTDRAQFAARHPLGEHSFSLALAARLQARGHLKDQPLPRRKGLVQDQVHQELKAHLRKMVDNRSLLGKLTGCNCRQGSAGGSATLILVIGFVWWRRSGRARQRRRRP